MFGGLGVDSEEEKGVPVWKLQTFDMVAKTPSWLENTKNLKAQLITALGNIVNNGCLCVMTSNV